jgi:hypothetical protein
MKLHQGKVSLNPCFYLVLSLNVTKFGIEFFHLHNHIFASLRNKIENSGASKNFIDCVHEKGKKKCFLIHRHSMSKLSCVCVCVKIPAVKLSSSKVSE